MLWSEALGFDRQNRLAEFLGQRGRALLQSRQRKTELTQLVGADSQTCEGDESDVWHEPTYITTSHLQLARISDAVSR